MVHFSQKNEDTSNGFNIVYIFMNFNKYQQERTTCYTGVTVLVLALRSKRTKIIIMSVFLERLAMRYILN